MVASVDARTLPLVMLRSSRVCLVVGDMSEHHDSNGSADCINKMNSPSGDVSFEHLMMQLARLRRMLVSVMAAFFNLTEGIPLPCAMTEKVCMAALYLQRNNDNIHTFLQYSDWLITLNVVVICL